MTRGDRNDGVLTSCFWRGRAAAAEGKREKGDGKQGGAGGFRDAGEVECVETDGVDLTGIGSGSAS